MIDVDAATLLIFSLDFYSTIYFWEIKNHPFFCKICGVERHLKVSVIAKVLMNTSPLTTL